MRPSGSPRELEQRRLRALRLLAEGFWPVEVARQVGVDRRSVRRWKAAACKGGTRAVAAKPAAGRPRRLVARDLMRLRRMLLQGAQAAGLATDLWTCPRVAWLIQRRFGVRYHPAHVSRLLHGLGFTPQKPTRRAVERDEQRIRAWIKQDWPRVKNAARLRAALVFLDESGMLMAPLVRRSWSVRGQTPVLRQRGRSHQKVSAIAALCILPTRDRIALYFRLYPDANIHAEHAMAFLEHPQRQLHTPNVLIWDSAQVHKGELVKQCVLPDSAHLEYLPPYAPELNPVEYLWAWLKTNPLANNPSLDLQLLAHRARRAARSAQHRQPLLRAFLRHTGLSLRLK